MDKSPGIHGHDKPSVLIHNVWKYPERILIVQVHYFNNLIHRHGDKPALFEYDNQGKLTRMAWYKQGKLYRVGGPAVIEYAGEMVKKTWYTNNSIGNPLGPSIVEVRPSGTKNIYFNQDQQLSHPTNPSVVCLETHTHVCRSLQWYMNDQLHREDQPAWIEFDQAGVLKAQRWYQAGKLHREGRGPAMIFFDQGSVCGQYWYFKGAFKRGSGQELLANQQHLALLTHAGLANDSIGNSQDSLSRRVL